MKSKAFFTASRLIVMVLACVSLLSIASCSKDDDNPGIVGTWVYGESSFRFGSGGTGVYESGGDVWGDFTYNVSSSNTVYMRITTSTANIRVSGRMRLKVPIILQKTSSGTTERNTPGRSNPIASAPAISENLCIKSAGVSFLYSDLPTRAKRGEGREG